jgi:hypothetical protein
MFSNAIAVVGFAAMVSGRAIVYRNETTPVNTPSTIIETPIPTFLTPEVPTPTTVTLTPPVIIETPIETPSASTPVIIETPSASTPVIIETPPVIIETPIATPSASTPVIIETPSASTPVIIETPPVIIETPIATPSASTPVIIETPTTSVPVIIETPMPGMPTGALNGPCKMEGMWNCVDGASFQRCASGAWSVVQPMAAGTMCKTGHTMNFEILHGTAPVPTPIGGGPGPVETPVPGTTPGSPAGSLAGVCDNEGEWNCIDGSAFQRCASGAWSMALPVAAGTKCTKGRTMDFQMIPTHSFMHRKRRVVV